MAHSSSTCLAERMLEHSSSTCLAERMLELQALVGGAQDDPVGHGARFSPTNTSKRRLLGPIPEAY